MSELISGSTVEQEISSATDTVPFGAIPTKRFNRGDLCYQPPRGMEDGFAFQVTLPPSGPENQFTAHGQLINTLIKKRLIGVTVYIKVNVMSVTDNVDTLALLIELVRECDLKEFKWARDIVEHATMALKRLQATGQ